MTMKAFKRIGAEYVETPLEEGTKIRIGDITVFERNGEVIVHSENGYLVIEPQCTNQVIVTSKEE